MERLNEARFIGNVGQFKKTEKSVYRALAINESYKPKDATEWVYNTVWVDVIAFGPTIEKIEKAGIEKGDGVLVIGKFSQREYEGKRYTQVVAQKVQLIQKSKKNSGAGAPPVGDSEMPTDSAPPPEAPAASAAPKTDDDLPF